LANVLTVRVKLAAAHARHLNCLFAQLNRCNAREIETQRLNQQIAKRTIKRLNFLVLYKTR
jgi:hypothetical protein